MCDIVLLRFVLITGIIYFLEVVWQLQRYFFVQSLDFGFTYCFIGYCDMFLQYFVDFHPCIVCFFCC